MKLLSKLVEFQKRLHDEISANALAWTALTNAVEESAMGWGWVLDTTVRGWQRIADWLNINIDLSDNLALAFARNVDLMYGSTKNLEQLLSRMATDETMRMALGDPNFIANLRREFEDADPAVRRQIEAMILFADAIDRGVLPSSLEMQSALKELGFTTEEIVRIMQYSNWPIHALYLGRSGVSGEWSWVVPDFRPGFFGCGYIVPHSSSAQLDLG